MRRSQTKRSDPADPYCLVLATPRQKSDDASLAAEQAVEKALSRPPSQPANNVSKTDGTAAPARPVVSKAPQAIQLFVSRAPNVIVQSQPDGQTRLVPQQTMRLLLSQGSHAPIEQPRPMRVMVQQQTVPPPSSPPPMLVGQPQVAWSPSGLVISDVRSQAPGQPGNVYPGPLPIVRRRGPHWPTEEKIQLLELLKSRRALINPRLGESLSKKDKLEGWKEVTDILNRHHPTTGGRCLAEVKKQWQNLFLKAKRERRELLNNGSKSDADLTSAQFTALSVKVFETVGDEFQLRDDDTPMDVDAGDSILGPSSCLESDAPYLSESHHPEVILLPRTPDPSEMSSQLTDDSEFKYGGSMSNGDSSQPFDDHVFDGENHVGSSKHSTTNGNLPAPLMRIKKEPEDPPPEPKLDYWAEPGGSEEERSTASWDARPHARTDYMDGQVNGTTFMGSITKMCDAVQKAASEVVSLKRREHKMKMSVLRAKMEYYETKRRKLQQQSEGGGGVA
ncbi:hypothetical protein HPB51_002721 [Rhipicephalus microplus]|uniref:Regulatory protein zeste n=1 Tax=Rhipicephalus microplus TaxID=6941 RepID=A0A9J6E562_RHIMP|nr:hypothetical protein HPB51_002721 [Rhipicephalus microplus]